MSAHPLDRPVWNALATRQAAFSVGDANARRFASEVGPLAGPRDESTESLVSLARIVPAAESIAVFHLQPGDPPQPAGTAYERVAAGVQMVLTTLATVRSSTARVELLTEADAPAMLALATLTRPGPFKARTHTLGTFVGIKEDGRLLAMAGERLQPPGFTEVSGVCTHPDARGRGYAALLSHTVASLILERGETPFLHAFADNTNAISIYRSLGFALRSSVTFVMLRRA